MYDLICWISENLFVYFPKRLKLTKSSVNASLTDLSCKNVNCIITVNLDK